LKTEERRGEGEKKSLKTEMFSDLHDLQGPARPARPARPSPISVPSPKAF